MVILANSTIRELEPRLFRTSHDRPMAMLKTCPVYTPTPIYKHSELAEVIGIKTLFIKDESKRMRLGSFKALGGAFAVAQIISDAAGTTDMESVAVKSTAADIKFMTASAGNHGLSIAAGAKIFGAHAIVFLSTNVPEGFANRIRSMNAEVVRVQGSYEDSVAAAITAAEIDNGLLLADGSWDGYIERPALVMEGYTVLAEECRFEFSKAKNWPTHVFLQAGVGGLAAAIAGHIRDYWDEQPEIIIVEPDAAPCLIESFKAHQLTAVAGPTTNMGRLDCKDASLIAFQSLKNDADTFVTISDFMAKNATSFLRAHGIPTTPSGAAGLAALKIIKLEPTNRCLLIITEGLEEG
jgi:diaminopropionate ammonia-lyase